ncbi:hypothetical protein [Methanolapillus ohkumae]|uniref:DUF1922 domain-containing protein n=1 Tax=Methanolapillus ohkumae TaxID=3028298 RepID=A0AA96V8B9_9EURY|nr:hypothetical protein MsAm2_14730 [Methanosarcinaceae archaeon Am2]
MYLVFVCPKCKRNAQYLIPGHKTVGCQRCKSILKTQSLNWIDSFEKVEDARNLMSKLQAELDNQPDGSFVERKEDGTAYRASTFSYTDRPKKEKIKEKISLLEELKKYDEFKEDKNYEKYNDESSLDEAQFIEKRKIEKNIRALEINEEEIQKKDLNKKIRKPHEIFCQILLEKGPMTREDCENYCKEKGIEPEKFRILEQKLKDEGEICFPKINTDEKKTVIAHVSKRH